MSYGGGVGADWRLVILGWCHVPPMDAPAKPLHHDRTGHSSAASTSQSHETLPDMPGEAPKSIDMPRQFPRPTFPSTVLPTVFGVRSGFGSLPASPAAGPCTILTAQNPMPGISDVVLDIVSAPSPHSLPPGGPMLPRLFTSTCLPVVGYLQRYCNVRLADRFCR